MPSGAPGPVLFRALRRLVSALLSLIVVLLPCFAPIGSKRVVSGLVPLPDTG